MLIRLLLIFYSIETDINIQKIVSSTLSYQSQISDIYITEYNIPYLLRDMLNYVA